MRDKVAKAVAPVKGRYSERFLHIPADMAVISVSLSSLVGLGAIALIVAGVLFLIGMVVFSA